MSDQVYKDMIDVMSARGMVFGGMDIPEFYRVAKALFTPEEAEINNAMPQKTFSAAELAEIMGRDEAELAVTLKQMADKGLCNTYVKGDLRLFRAAAFVPGIFEFVFMRGTTTDRDKELARLIKEYKDAWEAKSPIVIPYPMQRVITVDVTVETGNQVHTYDQVKTYIEQNDDIAAAACYCRHAALLRGEDTHGLPMQTCFSFGRTAQFAVECLGAKKLTKKEAHDILDECEEAGLVHMTHNIRDGVNYLCNCDKWHCYAIKVALKQPHPAKVFNSGFEPHWDKDACTACETCIDRCPAEALVMGDDDVPQVDLKRCFGCAVCATGCPEEAIKMRSKTEAVAPPKDNKALMEAMITAFSSKD
jgi:Pyruvate/2-oxoacid:ferredoxin oxidoreductase delta subunit